MPVIARRFCGPSDSGNGGYVAGLLAAEVSGTTEVTLRRPPPLDTALSVQRDDDGARLLGGEGTEIAQARRGGFAAAPPRPVTVAEADRAPGEFLAERGEHPYPQCFSCGTDRGEGDGLRVHPRPVAPGLVAALWVPHRHVSAQERVGVPVTWAAIDCIGYWAGGEDRPGMLLGRMTGESFTAPLVGREYVAVGALLGTEGRKLHAATALFTATGELVARSEQTWITPR